MEDHDNMIASLEARLEQALRQLEQQRTWRLEAERELGAAKRKLEDISGQLFAARDKIAGLERARAWASGKIGSEA
jgi:chromosome segregation ATPase